MRFQTLASRASRSVWSIDAENRQNIGMSPFDYTDSTVLSYPKKHRDRDISCQSIHKPRSFNMITPNYGRYGGK